MRFRAYGWHVEEVGEIANDLEGLEAVLRRCIEVTNKPSLVVLRSHIGFPAPTKMDTSEAHGSPLGIEEIRNTKELLHLPDKDFYVPDDVLGFYRSVGARNAKLSAEWDRRVAAHKNGGDFLDLMRIPSAADLDPMMPAYDAGTQVPTRVASGECLNALLAKVPQLVGGGADLTGNTGTMMKDVGVFTSRDSAGRLLHFGVREHGMGGIMNGLAAHGGAIAVGGTFFVFSDYMRAAVRIAAISKLKVIYSWTHDSLGVGEDGPTHQPIEHLASLRAMPGLCLIRPADGNETVAAWLIAIENQGPTALVLSRQSVPVLTGTKKLAREGVAKGAYVLSTSAKKEEAPDVVLVGTGSEVQLCVAAAVTVEARGYTVQVVSMPSWDLFDWQDDSYIDSVFPLGVPVVACEAGSSLGWERWADRIISIDTWGASGAAAKLMELYGFTAGAVAESAIQLLEHARRGTPR
jgi:transketolase